MIRIYIDLRQTPSLGNTFEGSGNRVLSTAIRKRTETRSISDVWNNSLKPIRRIRQRILEEVAATANADAMISFRAQCNNCIFLGSF